ncbi:MAG TPA: hypothetical protein VHV77_05635, partial [Pirellulales bacterium]|nr:hypothetical protein [Pirellulales bacterium]
MTFKREPLWRRMRAACAILLRRLFVEPVEELWFCLGLVDDSLEAAQLHRQGRTRRFWLLIGAGFRGLSAIPRTICRATVAMFWEAIYFFGLARDDADARLALRLGIGRRAISLAIALAMLVAAAVSVATVNSADMTAMYRKDLSRALDADDMELATVCCERLAVLQPSDPSYRYELALLEARRGNEAEAVILMLEIAPSKHAGYGPAHLWLARRLINKPTLTPNEIGIIWSHLSHALDDDSESVEANDLMSRLLVNVGRFDDAEPYLAKAAQRRPELFFLLAQSYAAKGRASEAQSFAHRTRDYLNEQLSADPDNEHRQIQLAEVL